MSESAQPLPVSTSLPPVFPQKQEALFRESLLLLNQSGIPYVVSGAFALHQHTGIWRVTKDLDLFLTAEDNLRALQILRQAGFECEICDPVWLSKTCRDGYFVDLITGMSNAIIVVDSSWIARGAPAIVLGIETNVLAAEELLVSKLFVLRRERFDGADIAHIIYATQGRLDWDRILSLVGDHWEMLLWALVLYRYVYPAHTDFVPRRVWQKLLSSFQQELENPDPQAPFRGSLVDDKMFAIDVAEWGMEDVLWKERSRRQAGIASEPTNGEPQS